MKTFALFCLIAAAVATPKVRFTGSQGHCEIERIANGDLKSSCDISYGGSSIEKNAVQIANLEIAVLGLQETVGKLQKQITGNDGDINKLQQTDIEHDKRIKAKAQKGETGAKGSQGQKGATGQKGQTGSRGYTGATGSKGQKGQTGSRGYTGATGSKGQKGQTGNTGARGYTGSKGQKGQTGNTGARGYTGSKGQKGQTGSRGYTGSKGQKGQKGQTGSRGYTGSTGSKGQKGQTGSRGANGGTSQSCSSRNTPCNFDGNGNVIYLDRHTMNCGHNEVLKGVYLRRCPKHGYSGSHGHYDGVYFNYQCCKFK